MSLTREEIEQLEQDRAANDAFEVDWERLDKLHGARFRFRRGLSTGAALVTVAAALGVLVGRFLPSTGGAARPRGELLIASLTPAPRLARSGDAGRVETTSDGTFAIRPGSPYSLIIRSPRAGAATLVVGEAGRSPVIYPTPRQSPLRVEAGKPFTFGPLRAPRSRTIALVVVADPQAASAVRAIIEGLSPAEIEASASRIQDALRDVRLPWAAINRIIIEPAPQATPLTAPTH